MGNFARLACLALILLLLRLPVVSAAGPGASVPPTGPLVYHAYLLSGFFEYFPITAFANSTVVQYSTVSDTGVSTALMTAAQLSAFNSSSGVVSDSIAYKNGSMTSNAVGVGPGAYAVVVYAYGSPANLTVSISAFPNNPFAFGPLRSPEPSGIASFGLTNESGVDNPYSVASTDVIGLAAIDSLEALNSSADSVGVHPTGATLQLNSMLVVEAAAGNQVYWCQNTPDFVTSASQVSFADNVWNASLGGVLTNSSISSEGGLGTVSAFQENGTTLYFYATQGQNSTYSLPLGIALLINASVERGRGVLVQFGASVAGGALGTSRTEWFDNVTIGDPTATAAYFLTNGNYSTPQGMFYDTELVFGGEGNGEETYFPNMTASLGLYYANGTTPLLSTFPSYFSFGLDTKETADNLAMTYLGNGTSRVTTGAPNYVYLGSASGTTTAAAAEASLGFPSPTVTPTSTSTSVTSPSASTTTTQSATSSIPASGVPEFPLQAVAVGLVAVLTLTAYLTVRRRAIRKPPRVPAWAR